MTGQWCARGAYVDLGVLKRGWTSLWSGGGWSRPVGHRYFPSRCEPYQMGAGRGVPKLPCWFINPTSWPLLSCLFLKQSPILDSSVAVGLSYHPILACARSVFNLRLHVVLFLFSRTIPVLTRLRGVLYVASVEIVRRVLMWINFW